jgi:hypothetical protein
MRKIVFIIIAIAARATAQLAAASEKIVGGPFVVGVGGKTAKVVWLVQSDEAALQLARDGAMTSPSFRVETTRVSSEVGNTGN